MDDLPPEPGNLRFLRLLVTVLTATMIVGMATVVTLLVLRFNTPAPAAPQMFPASITLPDGAIATAFTAGDGWYAVVTDQSTLLIFDAETGALRQTVPIATE